MDVCDLFQYENKQNVYWAPEQSEEQCSLQLKVTLPLLYTTKLYQVQEVDLIWYSHLCIPNIQYLLALKIQILS